MEEFLEAREFLSFLLSFGIEDKKRPESAKRRLSSLIKKVETKQDIKYEIEYFILPNGKKHGKYISKCGRGKEAIVEIEYKDGKQIFRRVFYKTGEKLSETNYVNGRKHGKYLKWYRNGNLHSEINYDDGKYHGKTKEWWKNGKPRGETDLVNGVFHGSYTTWDSNGRRYENIYSNGILCENSNFL